MAPRTRSMPPVAIESGNALRAPSPSPTSTVFSPLFDTDIHEVPSSASSWDSHQDHNWPFQPQIPLTPFLLFSLLWRGVPGFLRPGPFSSATWVDISIMGCRITIEEFLDNVLANPLNTFGIRFPNTRTFQSYRQMLIDALYWDLMLAIAIVGTLVILALRLFLEVVLWGFIFLILYLVLHMGHYLAGVWNNLALLVKDILPQSEMTWLLDQYSAHHVTNDQSIFQPGTFLLTDHQAALRGHFTELAPSQAGSDAALTLRGHKVVGAGRVLHRFCQITEDYQKICADALLNISVLYVPAAPTSSISTWGLMVNEQLRSEVSCFNQLVHKGPDSEFRQTSCYDTDARDSRILKLESRWRKGLSNTIRTVHQK